jgi:hypothetical protein
MESFPSKTCRTGVSHPATLTYTPPNLSASIPASKPTWTPAQSKTTPTPSPSVNDRHLSPTSSFTGSITAWQISTACSLLLTVGSEMNTLPTPRTRRIIATAMATGPPPIHNTDSLLQSCTRAQAAACWATASGSISAARSSGTDSGRTWHMLASTATASDNPPPNPDRPRNPHLAQPLVFEAWQLVQEPQQRRGSTITAWPTLRFEDESAGACITRPQNS